MIHLTIDGTCICQHQFTRCEYPTRQDGIDAMVNTIVDERVMVSLGPCPHKEGV